MTQTWNSELYESKHYYVSQLATDLVTQLAPKPGELILDLGCGTGHLTAKIAESGATVIGCDNSGSMIAQAQANYPQIEFKLENGEQLSETHVFDAIFSNAALHWMTNAQAVVQGIQNALKPGGRLVAEFGGKGNVQAIVSAVEETLAAQGYSFPQKIWYFPSISEYVSLLENNGLEVRFAQLFDRPTALEGEDGLRNWIAMFASHLLSPVPLNEREELLNNIETTLQTHLYQQNSWFADYRRLRIEAIKN
ncbi:class I SAM-dependent methyltransferase [Roseofilum sp. Guam]|uniref:class I SAM-dependent methyltransferase n=1 Tax=Roseofilum sp. Guam TaxID=2821502 RepID=UPI001B07598E|nr:class I SAM-dependent methyltransferase [Roseofilum sp. Guam]MBP0030962.1 class I SAM-dependent methyltransferase [Roseofilum sp. Guam]